MHQLTTPRRLAGAALLIATLLCSNSCAVLDKDQRRLTRLTWTLVPEETLPTALSAPLWVVGCTATLVADALVVNPVFNAPAAVSDANWTFFGFGLIPIIEIPLLPARAIAWPVLFLGSEMLRCTIPWYPL